MANEYSNKSNALRGAKRAGLADGTFTLEQNASGKWFVVTNKVLGATFNTKPADDFEAPAEELAAQVGRESADIARDEALTEVRSANKVSVKKMAANKIPVEKLATPAVAEVVKPVTYKEMTRHEKSLVKKPFNVVHSFLDANPTMRRRDAIAALVDQGVNFYTARTQYQRWFTNQKEGK